MGVGGGRGGGVGVEGNIDPVSSAALEKKKRYCHQNGLIVQSEAATVQSRCHVPPHSRDL